jgi:hypothetical protein
MLDFIRSSSPGDLWIGERATTTLSGISTMANATIEEVSHYLASCWRYTRKWPTVFPPPSAAWRLATPSYPSFAGIAPSTTTFPAQMGATGPLLAVRLAVADGLRP